MTQPVNVAITGGIGTGKSEMLKAFERQGAAVISSDEIVHELLREDAHIKQEITERFGNSVLDEFDEINRSAIASIVFSDSAQLAWLEELLHPVVSVAYLRWRELLSELDDPPSVCVTEVPLLYETGSDQYFDFVVAVTASPEVRLSRSLAPDAGIREKRFLPEEEKLARADFRFINDGSVEDLDSFVKEIFEDIVQKRPGCSEG